MTFPGVDGTPAGAWVSKGQRQVRQSFAGYYPGQPHYQSVVTSWGSHAPAWAVTAANVTVEEEVQDEPHPIEEDNFEEGVSEGGIDQFGVDQDNSSFSNADADPGYEGQ